VIRTCGQCHTIISGHEGYTQTNCCHVDICNKCGEDPHTYKIIHIKGTRTVICKEHSYVCELCGYWSTEKTTTTCCDRIICKGCVTFCDGCNQVHCIEHCVDNKCTDVGCCHSNKKDCMYNGHICSECYKPSIMIRCHPIRGCKQKFCPSCFDSKSWVCGHCREIVAMDQIRSCDMCRKTQCIKHMKYIDSGKRYMCVGCHEKLMALCKLS
jgi:hypothetical protein